MIRAPAGMRGSASWTSASGADDVDAQRALEDVERQVGERRQRRRAERAGVVDEQVDPLAGQPQQPAAVPGVGDVAGDRQHLGAVLRQQRARRLELVLVAGVDDEAPAALGERLAPARGRARARRR